MQGNKTPARGDRKLDSYFRICKRCDEFFRASSRGCNICNKCNMNLPENYFRRFEKKLKGGSK